MDITLFPYQIKSIERMKEREKSCKITKNNIEIETHFSIVGDMVGSGKSLMIVGLIAQDLPEWNCENVKKRIINYSPGNYTIFDIVNNNRIKLNCTVILASISLVTQWKNEFKHCKKIRIKVITTVANINDFDVNDCDVVIVSSTMCNRFFSNYPEDMYIWRRFVYDEPDSTHIPSRQNICAYFTWYLTATYMNLLYLRNKKSVLCRFFNTMGEHTLSQLVIKNSDDFIRQSFVKPVITKKEYKCINPSLGEVVNGFVSPEILEMIQAGDIANAISHLGGKSTEDIISIVQKKKKDELTRAEFSLQMNTIEKNKKIHEESLKRVEKIKAELIEIEKRSKDMLKEDCPICYDSMDNPVFVPCCHHLYCDQCILHWVMNNKNCPMCRSKLSLNDLKNIVHKEKLKVKEIKKSKPEILTQVEMTEKILKDNKDKQFIIVSNHDGTFYTIQNVIKNLGMSVKEIKGSSATRTKILKEYRENKIQVLFLNSKVSQAGINAETADDILFYHSVDSETETQVIGRALRQNRTKSLTIHYLTF